MAGRTDSHTNVSGEDAIATFVERWWAGEAGLAGRVLDVATFPLEAGYRAAMRVREAWYSREAAVTRVEVPVISVGNISIGGAGKTPVTRWIAEELRERGVRPAVLHGGYADDEPALHRSWNPDIPVFVGRDRIESARRAIDRGAGALILDDAYQHRRLGRDLDIVLVAAERWDSSPRLLPRGPWREAPRALGRAGLIIVTRKTASIGAARAVADEIARWTESAEPAVVHLAPSSWRRNGQRTTSAPTEEAVAVAAIASPEEFIQNATEAGAQVVDSVTFRDHHDYASQDVERIVERARGRAIVTTAKDAVKLEAVASELELWVLEQELRLEDGADRIIGRLDALVP